MTEIDTSEARQHLSRAAKLAYAATTGTQRPLMHLGSITYIEWQLELARKAMVNGARAEGASWADVGRALGISRQAARQTYGVIDGVAADPHQDPLPFD